jgi:hypothetical protein
MKELTNDLKDKLPLSLTLTLFLKTPCTMRGKMVLRGAVGKEDVPIILSKFHEGICGRNFARKIIMKKILHNGYH